MVNLDVTDVHQHLTHWQNLRPIVTVTRSIWNHSNVNSVKEDSIYSIDWKNMRNGIYPCKISADQGSADGLRIQKRNYMRNPSIKGHLFANIVTKPLNAIQRWSLIFACTPANDPFLAMSVERAMYPTRLWASIGRCTKMKISYKEIIVHKFLQNIMIINNFNQKTAFSCFNKYDHNSPEGVFHFGIEPLHVTSSCDNRHESCLFIFGQEWENHTGDQRWTTPTGILQVWQWR